MISSINSSSGSGFTVYGSFLWCRVPFWGLSSKGTGSTGLWLRVPFCGLCNEDSHVLGSTWGHHIYGNEQGA